MNFTPFNSESKDSIMIEIKGEMTSQDARAVASVTAEGRKWFWIFTGIGASIGIAVLLACFGISLIKWW